METNYPRSADVPPFAAIGLFCAVIIGMLYFEHRPTWSLNIENLDRALEMNLVAISTLLGSMSVNVMAAYSIFTSRFGLRKQGSRLAILTGRDDRTTKNGLAIIGTLVLAVVCTIGFIVKFNGFELSGPLQIPSEFRKSILIFCCSQLGLSAALCLSMAYRAFGFKISKFIIADRLPKIPSAKNSVVLGSSGELE